MLFICYVNNIILFILLVHNTVYFFTSSKSMRTVKNRQKIVSHTRVSVSQQRKKNNLEEIIRLKLSIQLCWRRRKDYECTFFRERRRDHSLCFLSDTGNDVTSFAKTAGKGISSKWCDIKVRRSQRSESIAERFQLFFLQVISLQLSHLSVSFCIYSHHHTSIVMCRHIDLISMNLLCCWSSQSPAHGHMWFTKVLSQLHHSITVCRNTNTCMSVQQWSINDNSNNKMFQKESVCVFCRALM